MGRGPRAWKSVFRVKTVTRAERAKTIACSSTRCFGSRGQERHGAIFRPNSAKRNSQFQRFRRWAEGRAFGSVYAKRCPWSPIATIRASTRGGRKRRSDAPEIGRSRGGHRHAGLSPRRRGSTPSSSGKAIRRASFRRLARCMTAAPPNITVAFVLLF